jgi:NAD(P)-dependent dehydrogenase (short-subunit alcohol dehydrogenase family)
MARLELRDKVVLVTGGARGIGLATGRALVARGARVVLVDLDLAAAERAAAGLDPDRALGLAADVTDRAALGRAVTAAVARFGGIDVVVANAGIASRAATTRAMAPDRFDRVLDVNLHGAHRTVEATLPEVVRRGGHVVLVASIYAFNNGFGAAPYAMSKAAVESLGRTLRVELAPHGATAGVAYFGWIDTELVRRAVDADPLVDEMLATMPRPLRKRLSADAAGTALADGIARRAPRVIRPRRWVAFSVLRGVLGPLLDAQAVRDERTRAIVRRLDERAGEDQPTTA